MSKKILLIDATYQVQSFIELKKALKHIYKDKVDVVSNWDEYIYFGKSKISYPAIVKLKIAVRRNYYTNNFSRTSLFKRDMGTCQYCGLELTRATITMDHVIPKSQGGDTSFANCVISCYACNNRKGNRTPEQANMTLLKKPAHPTIFSLQRELDPQEHWHPDWDYFIKKSRDS